MRKILMIHFHSIRKAKAVDWETPKIILEEYGKWDFNNYIVFERNGFTFRISCDYVNIFPKHEVEIGLDGIMVYQDKWIHSTPLEMKDEIISTVREINQINCEWKRNKLNKVYRELQKEQEKEKQQEKIKAFEDEKRRLHEKYKNKKSK